jgi:hypothetical protein
LITLVNTTENQKDETKNNITETKNNETEINKGIIESKDLSNELSKLLENFNNINDIYKPTDEEIAQQKDSIPEETKKRLAENNIPEEQYLRFSIAREKIYQT